MPGSPAIGTGKNLTSLCTGELAALCTDAAGAARQPLPDSWDIGAYAFGSGPVGPPQPPKGLVATVQ